MINKIKTISILAIYCIVNAANAQNPIATVGPWSGNQSVTVHNGGVGTITPGGKMEVKYQPCANQQNGLIITSLGCNQSTYNYNPTLLDGLQFYDLNNQPPQPPVPVLVFGPSFTLTTAAIPVVNANDKPMFWIRDENLPNSSFLGSTGTTTYNTKFIVMPNGNTGINTSNPRSTLDVVQFSSAPKNEPTAVFGKINPGTQTVLSGVNSENNPVTAPGVYGYRTKQIMIYNNLGLKNYNRIVQDKDQGILFTDGLNSDGSNQNGALVIAPWASNYTSPSSTVGGIRINKDGDVDVHGQLKATKVVVNAKWWSDFVFLETYNLISLDSVKNFINNYGHLPNVPSEKTILDSGFNVADMQAIQLQKIEELTLYLIEQSNIIKDLRLQIEAQDRKIEALTKKD